MVTRDEFEEYLNSVKKPFMKTFYERLRKKTGILMDGKKPEGGKYSYDSENRSKLSKDIDPPPLVYPKPENTPHFNEVKEVVENHFKDHPGDCGNFWLATERKEALKVFRRFLKERLPSFGKYQDAITSRSDFVFHSVISPYINMGLLLPHEVIAEVEKEYQSNKNIPLNSAEGFIRQVLGWREFVRGIYQNFDEEQQSTNFFQHKRKLTKHWYEGTTGVPPLDDAIKKSMKYGYAHHIERLMIISNLMLLCQIDPKECYRWFMEMFVDSSDWVMGPNVFGMGQFSDGGIFATKPYFSGSNYLLKMSDYKKGDWCQAVDGLYWSFIERNKEFFSSNPRLGMMVRTLEKMDKERKKEIYKAAEDFVKATTA
jgi:deoxyribodipyrimidine photolyase-related protein